VSPFNLATFLDVPNFSREEHKNLHIEQAGLPPEWEEDIWAWTAGYEQKLKSSYAANTLIYSIGSLAPQCG
jgi:hypothetical protein